MVKYLLITKIVEMVSNKYKLPIAEAREKVYLSGITKLIENDETGLYGESALYIFDQYEKQIMGCSSNWAFEYKLI